MTFDDAVSSHPSSPQSPLQPLNVMHTMITILGVHSSGTSVQNTVGFEVISLFLRVVSVVVDVGLLFIPRADSLLLISDGSSSASAATNVLSLR